MERCTFDTWHLQRHAFPPCRALQAFIPKNQSSDKTQKESDPSLFLVFSWDMIVGTYFIKNGVLTPAGQFTGPVANSVYEIMRIIDSKPLFWKEHLARMQKSMMADGWNFAVDEENLQKMLENLINRNRITFSNLQISVYPFGKAFHTGMIQMPTLLPDPHLYQTGVALATIHLERPSPNAKHILPDIRKTVAQTLNDKKVWELLLVNRCGEITEGSRSNVFFIHKNSLITPPANQILPGITRQVILSLCQKAGIHVREEVVKQKELPHFEALFISGTTPGVLPVKQVNKQRFDTTHPMLFQIRQAYQNAIQEDLRNFHFSGTLF